MAKGAVSTKEHKRIHVIARNEGWAVKREGNTRASKIYHTKDEAVQNARQIAKGHDVVIHRRDGSVQKWERVYPSDRFDSGEARIQKLCELIQVSRFSIHDLSRIQSTLRVSA